MFLRIFQHLLPNARAWVITTAKPLRELFEGLAAGVGDPFKLFFDQVWEDLYPQTTRELDKWDGQFALPNVGLTEQERRDRLDAAWKARGGQDPGYIQDTLRAAGFDVYVHEWWVPGSEPAVDVISAATARNPLIILDDGTTRNLSCDGAADMQDGGVTAMDGAIAQSSGYPLVNKLLVLQGGVYVPLVYTMPTDPLTFPYYLYIGDVTFPNNASVLISRKEEFETLCLKICPTQNWLGMLVTYVASIPTTYSEYILSLNPIAYWRLNDLDTTTEVVDSVSGYNGSRVGTTTFGVPGLIPGEPDTALRLPGVNTNRIDLPDIAALRPTTDITIEILVDQVGGLGHNLFKMWSGNAIDGSGWGITIFPTTGIRFYLATVGESNSDADLNGWFQALNVISTTGAYLITCTYDGVNRKIYVDGVLVGTNARTGAIKYGPIGLPAVAEAPYIGAHVLNGVFSGEGTNSVIQHVALWDRAKTAAEILATQGFR